MPTRTRHRRVSARRGFTLVELLLALAITGLAGAAIASMLFAAGYGTAAERTRRAVTVQKKVVRHRLDAAIRSARMVLDRGDGYLVLWTAERRDLGVPNLSELRRVELDTESARLLNYHPPHDIPAEDDTAYELEDTDFGAETQSLKESGRLTGEPWASGVSEWETRLDDTNPYRARLVSYALSVRAGGASATATSTAALRRTADQP